MKNWLAFLGLLLHVTAMAAPLPVIALTIDGNVAKSIVLDRQALQRLPMHSITTRTPWSVRTTYTGPLLRDVLDSAGPRGQTLLLTALDDYSVTISMADLMQYKIIAAIQKNGHPLTIREFGPVRIIYPMDQFSELKTLSTDSKMVWYLSKITIL